MTAELAVTETVTRRFIGSWALFSISVNTAVPPVLCRYGIREIGQGAGMPCYPLWPSVWRFVALFRHLIYHQEEENGMRSFGFLRENKKTLVAVAGLILVCVSIALSACSVEKNTAEQSHESLAEIAGTENPVKNPENDTMLESHAETQTEQSSEQGTEPASESVTESQPESTEKPEPILTADYELIYEGINIFDTFHYAAFKYMNT